MVEVVAVEGLRPPAPWVLFESTSFAGRFYFLNSVTNESRWSLPEAVFTAPVGGAAVPDPHEQPEDAFKRALTAAREVGVDSEDLPDEQNSPGESFAKRERDILDPRVISTDLEALLTTAINKASSMEQSMSTLTIAKNAPSSSASMSASASGAKGRSPKHLVVVPSSDSFRAIRNSVDAEGKGEGGGEDAPKAAAGLGTIPEAAQQGAPQTCSGRSGGESSGGGKKASPVSSAAMGAAASVSSSSSSSSSSSASSLSSAAEAECGESGGAKSSASSGPADAYTVLNGLGSGGYSHVLLVREKKRDELFAMKAVAKRLLTTDRDQDRLRNELRALTEVSQASAPVTMDAIMQSVSPLRSLSRLVYLSNIGSPQNIAHLSSAFRSQHHGSCSGASRRSRRLRMHSSSLSSSRAVTSSSTSRGASTPQPSATSMPVFRSARREF